MIDIDLHLHTHYSDGSESPEDLVARAYREGLRTIAVTDHDGIDGVPGAIRAGEALGLRVIPGLEFSAEWLFESSAADGELHTIHILGYGIDLGNDLLKEKMQEIRSSRADRNRRLRHAFREKGISIGQRELESYSPGGFVGKRSFAETLIKMGLASSLEDAFASEHLMSDPRIRSIRKVKTSAEEAIRIIHAAGGKAFLAHPYQLSYPSLIRDPGGFSDRLALVTAALRQLGLDGLECYYPTHDADRTAYVLTLADRNGMLVSIGSDDHGPNARKIKKIRSFQVEADPRRLSWIATV